ncbi:MAG: hypothetical protein AB3N06_09030 [Erythrobacter sp.]
MSVTGAVSFFALLLAAAFRGVFALVDFLAADFLEAAGLRFFCAPSARVSAMMIVLALKSVSSGEFAFDAATQLAPQCSGA